MKLSIGSEWWMELGTRMIAEPIARRSDPKKERQGSYRVLEEYLLWGEISRASDERETSIFQSRDETS
jgi:hypothetical protein